MATALLLNERPDNVPCDDEELAGLDPGYQLGLHISNADRARNLLQRRLENTPDELYECWDEVPSLEPTTNCVEDIVDEILAGVRGKLSGLSTGMSELRKQTSVLLTDFAIMQKEVTDVSSLCKELDAAAAMRVQNLDEVIYLNGLIKHLEDVDKEMVLVPCKFSEDMDPRSQKQNGNRVTLGGGNAMFGTGMHKNAVKPVGFMM